LQGIGVALAFVGVVGASLKPAAEPGGARRLGAGVGLSLLAAAGFGCTLVCLSRAADGGALWATLSMRATGAPLVVAAALLLRPRGEGTSRAWPLLVGVGLGDTGAT